MQDSLSSWNEGVARDAIVSFVERQRCRPRDTIPVADRVAVFDNDGTLWCEKPMPIQLDFILRRLAEMAEADRSCAPSALEGGLRARLRLAGPVIAEHYAGDDTNVPTLGGRVLAAFANISVDAFEAQSDAFLRRHRPPDPRSQLPRLCLRADGRAAGIPGGERLHELHRLRRRSRLHEADQRRASTASRESG